MNMTYKVVKCYHGSANYYYIYELPSKAYYVVTYESDDETLVPEKCIFASSLVEATNYFNKLKKERKNRRI